MTGPTMSERGQPWAGALKLGLGGACFADRQLGLAVATCIANEHQILHQCRSQEKHNHVLLNLGRIEAFLYIVDRYRSLFSSMIRSWPSHSSARKGSLRIRISSHLRFGTRERTKKSKTA